MNSKEEEGSILHEPTVTNEAIYKTESQDEVGESFTKIIEVLDADRNLPES